MLRTMVVAGHTAGARTVVAPLGELHVVQGNIARGTCLLAQTAVDTAGGVDGEMTVGDQVGVEPAPQDVGQQPGSSTAMISMWHHRALHNQVSEDGELLGGRLNFLLFALWLIRVHKRQTDVALRHAQPKVSMDVDTQKAEVFCQHLVSQSGTVAIGSQNVDIRVGTSAESSSGNKLPDDGGRPPTMHRKAEAESLVLAKLIAAVTSQLVGDSKQGLAQSCRNSLGCPLRVACTREIEEHDSKIEQERVRRQVIRRTCGPSAP